MITALVSLAISFGYMIVGAIAGAYSYRFLVPHCARLRRDGIHDERDCEHGSVATAIGIFWPIAIFFVLGVKMAYRKLPDPEVIRRLEREQWGRE